MESLIRSPECLDLFLYGAGYRSELAVIAGRHLGQVRFKTI